MIQAKTVLSIGNKELDEVLFSSPKKVVIYGEAATGKTNILLTILKHSVKELGRDDAIFYISTEGSVFF
uniref:Uncharacterized protein n=1 Tax=Ignisphaera aggregans TaxID=334771 RepID=A0A7C2VMN5_9CREN